MKISHFSKVAWLIMGYAAFILPAFAEKLVILHTNDIHSTIEPLADGTGGFLQRKAVIDSIRQAEKNVILVDAGDIVQGTVFFKYFSGDVEYTLMDMTGYDIRVLGNHEFDNGMESLAQYYSKTKGVPVSANYDFSGTVLDRVFKPYEIKEIDGKKIGFFGLNIDPASIIASKNIDVVYLDVIPVANETARKLKEEEGCDLVVAVTHIGYDKINEKPTDVELAESSRDIDIIIGGHTHTLIDPAYPEINPSLIENAEGKLVRVTQTGKQGRFLGKITVDLDKIGNGVNGDLWSYELIPVTDRFPEEQLDQEIISFLAPYREKVDSVNNHVIAKSAFDMPKERLGAMANMTADFGLFFANELADSLRNLGMQMPPVDLSIMNVGGIRHTFNRGDITEGLVLSTYPFSNRFVIIKIKGADIIEAMKVASRKGGEAISGNLRVVTDKVGNLIRVVINGKEMDPQKDYIVGTIDYVAEGNDDLVSMANNELLWTTDEEISVPILQWIKNQTLLGLPIAPDPNPRFVTDISLDTPDAP